MSRSLRMTRKSKYHHGDLHQALLEAGDAVLREEGLRKFTLRECARRAGVSHAAPKHHFGDVRGLLTELAAGGFTRLTSHLETELSRARDLPAEFAATTRGYLNFAVENPEHFRIMFRADLVDEESPVLREAASETFRVLTNVILRQRGKPEILADSDPLYRPMGEIVNDIVIGWSHIHGFAHLVLEQQLDMVQDSQHEAQIVEAAHRLSEMLQREGAEQ